MHTGTSIRILFIFILHLSALDFTEQTKCDPNTQVSRRSKSSGEYICCYFVQCHKNEQYKYCVEPNKNDSCAACKQGFVNPDEINTYVKDERMEEDVCKDVTILCGRKPPPGARRVNDDCHQTGISVYECDRARNFTGTEPQNCIPATVQCLQVGFELSFENTCIPCKSGYSKTQYGPYLCSKDKKEDNPKSSLIPSEAHILSARPENSETQTTTPESIIIRALTPEAGNSFTTPPPDKMSDYEITILGVVIGIGFITLTIVIIIITCHYRTESETQVGAPPDHPENKEGAPPDQPEIQERAPPDQPEIQERAPPDQPEIQEAAPPDQPEIQERAPPDQPEIQERAPPDQPEIQERAPPDQPEIQEAAPPDQPEIQERAPPDQPEIQERAPPDQPEIQEAAPPDQPEIQERAPPDQPEIQERAPPDQPEIQERAPPDQPEIQEAAPPDQPEIQERAPPDQPEIQERAPPDQPEIQERAPPDQPEIQEGAPVEQPNMEIGTLPEEPVIVDERRTQFERNLQRAAPCSPPDSSNVKPVVRQDDSLGLSSAPPLDPTSISSNEGSFIPNRYQSTGEEALSSSSLGLQSADSLHLSSLNSGSTTSQEASAPSTNAIPALNHYTGSNIPVQRVLPLRESRDEVALQERQSLRQQTYTNAVFGVQEHPEEESSEMDPLL